MNSTLDKCTNVQIALPIRFTKLKKMTYIWITAGLFIIKHKSEGIGARQAKLAGMGSLVKMAQIYE
jgi:hypothetical protein